MGGTIVLPETDTNITKVIKNFKFEPKDIHHFWKIFQKLDKAKTGLVPLTVIFKKIEMERNLLTDCLLELLEIEHDGEINFSDFLLMVTQYCFFEPTEILKFCFFVFDQDKTGFFSIDDLNNLVNAVHNIKSGSTVRGTVKASWMQLTFKGEELDYQEFRQIHNQFPRLFQPAFRLQQQMMIHFMGELWWHRKKMRLEALKEEADAKIKQKEKKKEKKKNAKKARKTQRNMGFIRYYLCPCLRKYYDPTLSAYDKMTAEEKAARDRELALARRQAELKVKNPETAIWLKYQKKIANETVVVTTIEEEGTNVTTVKNGVVAGVTEAPSSSNAVVVINNSADEKSVVTSNSKVSKQNNVTTNGGGRSSIGGASERSSMQSSDGIGGGRNSLQSQQGASKQSNADAVVPVTTPSKSGTVSSITNASTLMPESKRMKKVVVNNYLDTKFTSIERNRATRAESRAERKKQRQQDPELKFKARSTLSGVDT